jgi:hypothetical protein
VTADPGTWDTADLEFTYQWRSEGADIFGATSASLTITPAVSGRPLTVQVTATAPDTSTGTAVSAAVDVPAVAPTIDRWTPSINWGATVIPVEAEATIEPGGWDVPDATFTYQWLHDGEEIPGATGATYLVPFEWLGDTMSAVVVAWNHGAASDPVATPEVTVGPGSIPFDEIPSITGEAKVGATLTLDPGSWHHEGVTTRYQWYVDYEEVPGETGLTYHVRADDVGKDVSAMVELTKPDYLPAWGFASGVTVGKGDLTSTAAPAITGTPQVGRTLKVRPGTWSSGDGVTLSYQWTAGGAPIPGATGTTYKVPAGAVGKRIAVVETASGVAYNDAAPQASTSVVAKKATSKIRLGLTSPARGKVKVAVTVKAAIKATGTAKVKIGRVVHRVKLRGGKGSTTFVKLRKGRKKVTATYAGTRAIAASRATATVRVK